MGGRSLGAKVSEDGERAFVLQRVSADERRRYVDTNVTVDVSTDPKTGGSRRTLVPAKKTDPRRQALEAFIKLNGIVPSDMGWFSKKMESACPPLLPATSELTVESAVLENGGFLARQEGLYAFHAYARR